MGYGTLVRAVTLHATVKQSTSMGSLSGETFFFRQSMDCRDQSPPSSSCFVVTAISSPFGSPVYHVKCFFRTKVINKPNPARPRGTRNSVVMETRSILHRLQEDVKSSNLLVQ